MASDADRRTLNQHGDVLVPTTGIHGSDISSQRIDELDIACLDFIRHCAASKERHVRAIDVGGGHGAQSKRMAECGADVVLIDLTDQSRNIDSFNERLGRTAIRFLQVDVRDFRSHMTIGNLDVIYSQRMISCVRYHHARELLTKLRALSNAGTHCFISAGGIETEVGAEYSVRDVAIEQRWGTVSREMAVKHQMFAPECLYSERELAALLTSCGFTVIRSWTSPFGNPKTICRR